MAGGTGGFNWLLDNPFTRMDMPLPGMTPGFNPDLDHPAAGMMDDRDMEDNDAGIPSNRQVDVLGGYDIGDEDLIQQFIEAAKRKRKKTAGGVISNIIQSAIAAGTQPARYSGTGPDILNALGTGMGQARQRELLDDELFEREKAQELSSLSGAIKSRQSGATTRSRVASDAARAGYYGAREESERRNKYKTNSQGDIYDPTTGKIITEAKRRTPAPPPSSEGEKIQSKYDAIRGILGGLGKTITPAQLDAIIGVKTTAPRSPSMPTPANALPYWRAKVLTLEAELQANPEDAEKASELAMAKNQVTAYEAEVNRQEKAKTELKKTEYGGQVGGGGKGKTAKPTQKEKIAELVRRVKQEVTEAWKTKAGKLPTQAELLKDAFRNVMDQNNYVNDEVELFRSDIAAVLKKEMGGKDTPGKVGFGGGDQMVNDNELKKKLDDYRKLY